ncbi:hypothetical protein IAT38_002895 [Cryptococcus sp. DSM 104549]
MALPIIRQARSIPSITPAALRAHLTSPPIHPLHLPGLVTHWPALSSWKLSDRLQAIRTAVDENRAVEIELGKKGRGYLHPDWQRVTMPFGLFLDAFIFNLIPSSSPSSALPTAYLAQSDLLASSPELQKAVPLLPHFDVGDEKSLYRRTIWIGPNGSFTPFHRDPYIGIYTQIIGRKRFHLVPPSTSPHLTPSPIARHANTSQIPLPVSHILAPEGTHDTSDLPLDIVRTCRTQLGKAFEAEGACEVEVGEGESVLLPEGWWHAAEGVGGPGVGVGAWFR